MAAKKMGNGFQGFVKVQIDEAQKRFTHFEADAERVLKNLIARGKEQRKELEGLVQKINVPEFPAMDRATVKQLSKRVDVAGTEVRKRLDVLQNRVVRAVGVASQSQVREITKELTRLSKKVDALVSRKGSKSELRS